MGEVIVYKYKLRRIKMSDNKPTQPVVTEEKRAELERQGREYLNLPMVDSQA